MPSTPRNIDTANLSLSSRTVANIPLSLKIVDGNEPWPTICLLGRLLVKLHDLTVAVDAAGKLLDTKLAVSPIDISYDGRYDENRTLIPNPHIPGIERYTAGLERDPRNLPLPDDALEAFNDYAHDSVVVGEHLDAVLRTLVPAIKDHPRYVLVTTGVEKVSGYRLSYLEKRTLAL
jgi:hypothetical protein